MAITGRTTEIVKITKIENKIKFIPAVILVAKI